MKRLALAALPGLLLACGGTVAVRATTPPPPEANVTVGVSGAPAPPAPGGPAAPPPPGAPAPPSAAAPAPPAVEVEVEPIVQGDPEEVTATTEPPDPVYEEQTDPPATGQVWVGGYWGWNGTDWGWNWGRWAEPPHGQVYVEPYYERVGGKVVYVRGSWGPPNAPKRSYGGDRIHFTAPVKPANYHRGEHVVVEHRAGPLPGKRPGGGYVHATGTVRPLPKATAPAHRVAEVHETTPRGGKEDVHATGHETTHETVHATGKEDVHGAGHETTKETVHATGKEDVHETTKETVHATGHETETAHGTATDDKKKGPEQKAETSPHGTTPEAHPADKKTEPAEKKPEATPGKSTEAHEAPKTEATEKKPEAAPGKSTETPKKEATDTKAAPAHSAAAQTPPKKGTEPEKK
jgi:hypothetical protein